MHESMPTGLEQSHSGRLPSCWRSEAARCVHRAQGRHSLGQAPSSKALALYQGVIPASCASVSPEGSHRLMEQEPSGCGAQHGLQPGSVGARHAFGASGIGVLAWVEAPESRGAFAAGGCWVSDEQGLQPAMIMASTKHLKNERTFGTNLLRAVHSIPMAPSRSYSLRSFQRVPPEELTRVA